MYSKAVQILQNIQDHHNLKRIVKGDDDIESKTVYFEGLGDLTQNTSYNKSDSENEFNLDEMIPEDMALMDNNELVA